MKKLLVLAIVASLLLSMTSCMESTPAENSGNSNGVVSTEVSAEKEETPVTEVKTTTVTEENVSYEITDSRIRLWVNSIGTTWMQGIVEVTNTGNTDLYLSSGKFELDGADGSILAVKDYINAYPQVIGPGEKAYYFEETTLECDSSTQVTLVPNLSIKKATVDKIRFTTSDFKLTDTDYFGVKALGRVENTTDKEDMPLIVVFCYDGNNKLNGLLYTYGDNMAAGEKTAEEVTSITSPDDFTTAVVDHFEVVAYPNQYQFN